MVIVIKKNSRFISKGKLLSSKIYQLRDIVSEPRVRVSEPRVRVSELSQQPRLYNFGLFYDLRCRQYIKLINSNPETSLSCHPYLVFHTDRKTALLRIEC